MADWTNISKFVYIDPALAANKTKQIKWIMTCVCLNGYSELNTQYFYMGIVQFDRQENRFGGRVQVFAKLIKLINFQANGSR